MICELPVLVSTQCGCAVDLVKEGQNGFTFDPSNEQKLVELMLQFTKNQVNTIKMGAQSKQIIKGFSPSVAAKSMLNGFELVVLQSKVK
jgi:glycosyltransferase involved in cell wall biosynthesis